MTIHLHAHCTVGQNNKTFLLLRASQLTVLPPSRKLFLLLIIFMQVSAVANQSQVSLKFYLHWHFYFTHHSVILSTSTAIIVRKNASFPESKVLELDLDYMIERMEIMWI